MSPGTDARSQCTGQVVRVQGDGKKLGELLSMLDSFNGQYNIVTP
ncbi:MAG: alkyl sulfatase C-terminal domain-containing protein [Pseudomonas sp.]